MSKYSKSSEVGVLHLQVLSSSLFEQFAGFSVITVGVFSFTLLGKADDLRQESSTGEMFFHETTTNTAILGHEGKSKSEVEFTSEDRAGKALSSSERSSTGSVDNLKSNIRLNSVVAESK